MSRPVPKWIPAPSIVHEEHRAQAEGFVSDSPVVELIAYAFNQAFTGRLTLERRVGQPISVAFDGGRIVAVDAAEHHQSCLRRVLEVSLPPEVLGFAEQHARTKQIDLLSAVEELMLLPAESLAVARRELVALQLNCTSEQPGDTRYRFEAGQACVAGTARTAEAIDPLSLLVSCILESPALERARRSVEAFRHVLLTLPSDVNIDSTRLNAVNRRWLEQLARAPSSFAQLVRLKPAEHSQLTALIYALLITGQAEVKTTASERPRPMHNSRVPRSISSQGVRAVTGSSTPPAPEAQPGGPAPPTHPPHAGYSSAPPARPSQQPGSTRATTPPYASPRGGSGQRVASRPPSTRPPDSRSGPISPRSQVQRECDAEAKVSQAWMLGEADSSALEKSRLFAGKVVQLYPHNPRIRYCFACLQKRAQNLDSAIEEFARVVELDPHHQDAKLELDSLLEWRRKRRHSERIA